MDAKGRSYSAVQGKQHLNRIVFAAVIAGTNASDTNIVNSFMSIPSSWNGVVKSATMYLLTGATGAGSLAVRLERSKAGTGTYSTIATFALGGTTASATAIAGTGVATTQILGGDVLRLVVGSGTIAVAATTLTAHFDVAFEESFVGA